MVFVSPLAGEKKERLSVNTIAQFTNARSIHRSFYK
jgi:hypothetical protein